MEEHSSRGRFIIEDPGTLLLPYFHVIRMIANLRITSRTSNGMQINVQENIDRPILGFIERLGMIAK
jgi:hypothetical protein